MDIRLINRWRRRVSFVVGLLVLAVLASGCGLQGGAAGSDNPGANGEVAAAAEGTVGGGTGGTADGATGDPVAAADGTDRLAVEVQPVVRDTISRGISFTGTVQGKADATLFAKVAAPTRVLEVTADVGDRVERGQVLIRLDADDIRHQVNQARAALTTAEAGLEQARIQYENAKSSYERMQSLHEEGAISDQEWESVKSQYELAKAQYEATAPAQVEQARAALDTAQSQLANTVIIAPIAGVVAGRSVEPGDLAAAGSPLMTLVNTDTLYVEGQLSDRQVARLEVGQEAEVSLEALPGSRLGAVVETVSPAANPQTRAFPVKVRLEEKPDGLRPGMFATVDVILERHEGALVVPVDSVVQRSGRSVVFVIEENQARMRPVETGISTGSLVEILSGVEEGEQVVVSGQGFLQDGMRVLVVGAGGEAADIGAAAAPGSGAVVAREEAR